MAAPGGVRRGELDVEDAARDAVVGAAVGALAGEEAAAGAAAVQLLGLGDHRRREVHAEVVAALAELDEVFGERAIAAADVIQAEVLPALADAQELAEAQALRLAAIPVHALRRRAMGVQLFAVVASDSGEVRAQAKLFM